MLLFLKNKTAFFMIEWTPQHPVTYFDGNYVWKGIFHLFFCFLNVGGKYTSNYKKNNRCV